MTTEEKAKAYDEALETAKRIISNNCTEVEELCLKCIFPQLKESEDERIRKVIYKLMLGMRKEIFTTADKLVTKPKVLAWLKKQKEHSLRDFIEDFPYSDQKEQKPAEWSEDIIRKAVKEVGLTQHQIDWFKTNVFSPKQEWSEEDEKWINYFYSLLGLAYEKDIHGLGQKAIDAKIWLKSLRPVSKESLQPHWKPSKAQMDEMEFVINDYREDGCNRVADCLQEILEQMKKL